MSDPAILSSNVDLIYAISQAKKRARRIGSQVWICDDGALFWMTDEYPEGAHIAARVYPDGRVWVKGEYSDLLHEVQP